MRDYCLDGSTDSMKGSREDLMTGWSLDCYCLDGSTDSMKGLREDLMTGWRAWLRRRMIGLFDGFDEGFEEGFEDGMELGLCDGSDEG